MPEVGATEQHLFGYLAQMFRGLPDVGAEFEREIPPVGPGGGAWQAQVRMRVPGQLLLLQAHAQELVFPRDVRRLVTQLQAGRQTPRAGQAATFPFLVARTISSNAKELLRRAKVGYCDTGGSLFLPAPGLYVYIDKPSPKPTGTWPRSLFSSRRTQVLHALLLRHRQWVGVTDLAQQALVSPSTSSQVLGELERLKWMAVRGQGTSKERQLREPAALLDAWARQAEQSRAPSLQRYYVPKLLGDALKLRMAQAFDAHGAEYAVSHEAAVQRGARPPCEVSQVRARVLPGMSADAAIGELGAQVVHHSGNLVIIRAKSPGELLFRERVGGLWFASPIHVYLDLLRDDGRGRDAAVRFRRERIGF